MNKSSAYVIVNWQLKYVQLAMVMTRLGELMAQTWTPSSQLMPSTCCARTTSSALRIAK